MNRDSDVKLFADDVYVAWRRRVRAASQSVLIFTPYLDRLAVDLLRNTDLPLQRVSVVTDLSPETGAHDYRNQLLALRRLLIKGVEIRSLPRLHAKVLVVDDASVTVGSQNFTGFGRGSRETTALLAPSVVDTTFLSTLRRWFSEAVPIELELVDRLLERTEDAAAEVKRAIQALLDGYDSVVSGFDQERAREAERRRLEEQPYLSPGEGIRRAALGSRYRNAQEIAFARLDWVEDRRYRSLIAERTTDLTEWRGVGGHEEVSLEPRSFYPVLIAPDERLGFARVAKSRITYVWRNFTRNPAIKVAGSRLHVRVTCPDPNPAGANLEILFGWDENPERGYVLSLRFDGLGAKAAGAGRLVGRVHSGARLQQIVDSAHADPHEWAEVLRQVLSPIQVARGFRWDYNADEVFSRGWMRIDLTTYLEQPVLLVRPLRRGDRFGLIDSVIRDFIAARRLRGPGSSRGSPRPSASAEQKGTPCRCLRTRMRGVRGLHSRPGCASGPRCR